jgi:WD40 repeat protein
MRSSLFVRQPNISFLYTAIFLAIGWMTPLAPAEEGVIQLRGYGPQVSGLAVSPDGKLLAVAGESRDYMVNIWDLGTRKKVASLAGHKGRITGLSFSPDGKFLAIATLRGTAQLWRVGSWERPLPFDPPDVVFRGLAFSPDGKRIVFCGSKPVGEKPIPVLLVWDAKARTWQEVTVPRKPLSGVVFLPDGKEMITAGDDGLLRFWDPATLKQKRTFNVAEDLKGLALSPDGKWLGLSSSPFRKPFVVYDIERHKVGWKEIMLASLTAMAFSPDSKLLVHHWGDWVGVWEADTGIFYRYVKPPKAAQNTALAFTPEGKLITAGSEGILIWDPKFLTPLPRH